MGSTRLIALTKIYTTPHEPHNEANILPAVRFKSFTTAGDDLFASSADDDVDAPSAPPRIVKTLLEANGEGCRGFPLS